MNEILTIVEHAEIIVAKTRDIEHNTISQEDRNLLFDIVYKDKKLKERYIFSHCGGNKIKASSIVGSVSLKNGLTVEILPKFAKGDLTKDSIKRHRKTLLSMVRVSNEKNFIISNAQSSKIPMEEMPLINYVIELFSSSLLSSLRQWLYSQYTKVINNSSYVRGNILVAKTIQNNFIDKSKVYTSYNKHSTNNLLMQTFRTLAKMLLEDENLSYRTKQNLHEIYLLLDGVDIINLKSEDFKRVVFNRLNDKFEVLHNQASFIFKKYMPFSSHINATPFWSILFDMDYLFEKFVACLFRKSNIEFKEQNTTDSFKYKNKTVSIKPDFIIENENKEMVCVADAKWKLLSNDKSQYGLNSQNFWQLFSYMNLVNPNKEINGYFIVPKNSGEFEDEIVFESIVDGNKSIKVLSIDFSLEFEELINRYRFNLLDNKLYIEQIIVKKDIEVEKSLEFDFKGFIDELELLSKDKTLLKNLKKNYKNNNQFKNIIFLKDEQNVNTKQFRNFITDNIKRTSLALDNLKIEYIPDNIKKLRSLTSLDLSNNKICNINSNIKQLVNLEVLKFFGNTSLKITSEIFNLPKLKQIFTDKKIIEMNIGIFKTLLEKGINIFDKSNIDLSEHIKAFELEELIQCTTSHGKNKSCGKYKSAESFKRLHIKTKYKTGICEDCVKSNKNKKDKELDPILRTRYNTLKDKAEKKNKILKFTQNEFVDKFTNDKVVENFYNKWIDSEDDERLKPNFYFLNENLDCYLSNVCATTTKEVEKFITYPAHSVVQFEKDNTPIKIFTSVKEAKLAMGLKGEGIYYCCTGVNNSAAGFKWKYKKDVSKEIIDFLESNKNELQNKREIEKNVTLESENKVIKELLVELRDNKISKEFTIDGTCILSPVMIDELIKYKPMDKDEFALKISSKLRKNLNRNQMTQFRDEIFEILEEFDG